FRRESDVGAEMSVKSEVSELAFCPGPIDCAAFDSQLVCQSRFAVYVHQAHPLADHKAITAKCLQGFPLTVMNEQTKALSLLLDAAKAAGVELWINNQTDSTKTLFELACVEGQVGVATMALQPIAALSKRKLKAIPFQEESLEWRLYLIKKKGAALSTNAKLLYDVLVTHMEKVKKC
ncbi:MAG: LysR substrate-binding domain-containing protein, partial [Oscillospiraceae bacterium]|nr:LysR substrate-binding domain-containing protein [Oscillospiraceae bacterium]